MVEILDRLPIPLTARLGGGSDKMIANGEPDSCYPEGSRRNRCVGGPGRDICYHGTAEQRLRGRRRADYCHHGGGSDGCWGGRGRRRLRDGRGTRRLPRRPGRRPTLRRTRVGSALRRTRPRLLRWRSRPRQVTLIARPARALGTPAALRCEEVSGDRRLHLASSRGASTLSVLIVLETAGRAHGDAPALLAEMSDGDELIVVGNDSIDGTTDVVERLAPMRASHAMAQQRLRCRLQRSGRAASGDLGGRHG